jgi:hypothetical protein
MLSHFKNQLQGSMTALLILTLISLMWFSAGVGESHATTSLHLAVLNGQIERIARQLGAGDDVNVADGSFEAISIIGCVLGGSGTWWRSTAVEEGAPPAGKFRLRRRRSSRRRDRFDFDVLASPTA